MNKILVLRTKKCRRSDRIIDFLQKERIPHEVKHIEEDPEAKRLVDVYNIRSSPGIIIRGQVINPFDLLKNCRVEKPHETKQMFLRLLQKEAKDA